MDFESEIRESLLSYRSLVDLFSLILLYTNAEETVTQWFSALGITS